tara:strand:- start:6001 stop:6357 length:357 start_codon:yes stop_codon:yes gene_type:complete
METTILIILAASIGYINNINRSTEYALNMEDGSKEHVILKKNSQYACPIYCDTDHVHKAILCSENTSIDDHTSVYHISMLGANDVLTYCSNKKILSMNKLKPHFGRKEIPGVINTSQD